MDLKDKVQNSIGQFCSECVLQIELVSLDDQVGVLGAPVRNHKNQMIFNHRNSGVRNEFLLRREGCVQVFLEFRSQILDDKSRVSNLPTVELNKWQLSLLGAELCLVVNILQKERNVKQQLLESNVNFKINI